MNGCVLYGTVTETDTLILYCSEIKLSKTKIIRKNTHAPKKYYAHTKKYLIGIFWRQSQSGLCACYKCSRCLNICWRIFGL
jgi:hypothetical protein